MSRFAAERRHGAFALALALLPGVNILTLHAVMSDAVTMGRADVLPTYAGGILAAAFGVAFFAPLWGRLRLGTEGEFLLWRYRGAWAARLHAVRSALLGLVVLPLAMGMMLVPMRAVLVHLGGCSPVAANGLLAMLLLAGADACAPGALVCRVPEQRPLAHGVTALPWQEFPAWLGRRVG